MGCALWELSVTVCVWSSSILSWLLLHGQTLLLCSHDRVLEAITVNGEECNINRFEPVLTALKMTKNPVLQLACMQFINAIVNTPEDLDFRVHLRNECMRCDLGDVLVVSVCSIHAHK